MNKDRRKMLGNIADGTREAEKTLKALYDEGNALIAQLNEKITEINEFRTNLKDDLIGSIEDVKSEEEEAYENLPESMQNGDKGSVMQEAIEYMDSSISALDGLYDLEEIGELECPDLDGDVATPLEDASNVG